MCYEAPKTVQPTRRRPHNVYHGLYDRSIASFGTSQDHDSEQNSLQTFNTNADDTQAKERGEKPDNPKWAIFYFVMYTIFSTYNLIAGKFFRMWYPSMSTF